MLLTSNGDSLSVLVYLHTMDYSIINHDSDTIFSFDLEFNLSEYDGTEIKNLESQEEIQIDDKISPWLDLPNNSFDMNGGADLSYSVMVNPRTVMGEVCSIPSAPKNDTLDSPTFVNSPNKKPHLKIIKTFQTRDCNFQLNESEVESDFEHLSGITESEEEADLEEDEKVEKKKNTFQHRLISNKKSKILSSNKFASLLIPQVLENQESIELQSPEINKIVVHNFTREDLAKVQHSQSMKSKNLETHCLKPQLTPLQEFTFTPRVKEVDDDNKTQGNDSGMYNGKCYPKPTYSYSCLIAMALKNSQNGLLPVSEIYKFMCDHFPYFKTAPSGWKNSVRHNLSLNKCFEKIEKANINGNQRKGCLWAINHSKKQKMDEEMKKWSVKDRALILNSLLNPEFLEPLENGELKHLYGKAGEQYFISEVDNNYTEEFGNSPSARIFSPQRISLLGNTTTLNTVINHSDQNSRDDKIDFTLQSTNKFNNSDPLQLSFISTHENITVSEINETENDSIFDKRQLSSVYENSQLNNSSIYQLSFPNDCSMYQSNRKVKQDNDSNSSSVISSISNNSDDNSFDCQYNKDISDQCSIKINKRQKTFTSTIRDNKIQTSNLHNEFGNKI